MALAPGAQSQIYKYTALDTFLASRSDSFERSGKRWRMKAKLEKKEGSSMKVTEIEIHAGDVDHPYRVVANISAKVETATPFPKTPTLENINFKLQEKASQLGATAVIKVEYNRGTSQASGVAVVLESDEVNWATEFLEYQR